jgi:tRNA threonylcarbamoyl adenosine modification protein (Sua5/YciO/YrdC/YwlC family)
MLIKIYEENPNPKEISKVVNCLKSGGLVIYPTDTVYGLGCDIFNKRAMERLYQFKGLKPKNKANFSIICYDLSHISEYAKQLDTPTYKLMRRTLPGPFTFILDASKQIPNFFVNNRKTIGIRVPDNLIARTIVKELGNPIVSTSVHHKDYIIDYITDPELIHEELGDLVDIVIDGGNGGIEPSTVVDCTGAEPEIVRQGKGIL